MKQRLTLLTLFAASITCGGGGNPGGVDADVSDTYDRTALLQNVVSAIIVPLYQQFEDDATALDGAVSAYCAALGTADEATSLDAAQSAWRVAMATWQRAELTQIGPTAASGDALRDAIYSWPIVSTCAVDREVVALRNDPTGYDIKTRLANRRGLDVLEYTLFGATLEATCLVEGWDALDDSQRRAARCAYATVVAGDLVDQADALVAAWSGDAGFAATLIAAGAPGSELASAHDGVDAVFGGLFYLDTYSKDRKLAAPLGLRANTCSAAIGTVCPADLESQHAGQVGPNLAANLAGFRALFLGGEGEGFDDFLRARGADVLADQIIAALDTADASLDGVQGSFADLLGSDPARIEAVHTDVREVTTKLKTEMPATLGLTIPDEAGGDTD
ncbi:MAG TPA: imelysin family protein [Kofleriaceae bacterium]|nr:imelysin family protein [Kofleriaceae bacterium]